MTGTIVAARVRSPIALDAERPSSEWNQAEPISFCADWQGKSVGSDLETTVRCLWSAARCLWSAATLYLRFECRYRELFVFPDADANGRRDHLWDRDVAEAFLQPDPSRSRHYREFEVSPNGQWIDLAISPDGLANLNSGLARSVWLDEASHTWTAELAIPMSSLTQNFDPAAAWRVNFYRVEGPQEPRRYLAWQPTRTDQPNFHVPSAFGEMRFAGL